VAWRSQAPPLPVTKRGAGREYSKVNGLNALLATISMPMARPVIARPGYARARPCPPAARTSSSPTPLLPPGPPAPPDWSSPGWTRPVTLTESLRLAIRRRGAHFSITARLNPAVLRASIDEQAWNPIHCPTGSGTPGSTRSYQRIGFAPPSTGITCAVMKRAPSPTRKTNTGPRSESALP
jgi:hypothetical protein